MCFDNDDIDEAFLTSSIKRERERESLCVGLCVVKSQVRLSILIVGYSSSNNESDFDECNFFSYETNFLKTLKDEKDEIKRR
jgi:hypothetical protein